MWQKFYFLLAGLFFVLMNVLLWRSEFANKDFSSPVPVQTVLWRVFESADDSSLEIRRHGAKIGFCRWIPSPISPIPSTTPPQRPALVPEGMLAAVAGYAVDLDGSVDLDNNSRLRFSVSIHVDTNHLWQELHLRLQTRPWRGEIHALAAQQSIVLILHDGENTRRHEFQFSDLNQPAHLLRQIGGPVLSDSLDLLGLSPDFLQPARITPSLTWEAHADRQKIGRTAVSVYRLQASLLDQYKLVFYALESGEILRIELPNDILLVNQDLLLL